MRPYDVLVRRKHSDVCNLHIDVQTTDNELPYADDALLIDINNTVAMLALNSLLLNIRR